MSKSSRTPRRRSLQKRTVHRRPGPRFTHEDKRATERRIQEAAVRLVTKRGLKDLTLRALGALPELRISGTAALHYFGSMPGLLGAIAAHGFDEVSGRLHRVRESVTPGIDSIRQLGLEYARFGLENPHLYRAIHAGRFWHSTTASRQATERAQRWIDRAVGARNCVVEEFLLAVRDAQRAGAVRDVSIALAAHVVTTLTDGFLFQTLEEHVGATKTMDEQLEDFERLLDLTLAGFIPPRDQRHNDPERTANEEAK
jgi:AcrR family transcriptional regulator